MRANSCRRGKGACPKPWMQLLVEPRVQLIVKPREQLMMDADQ
jgi:hypothetical protein